jgi:hypothetical protein
MSKEKRLSLFKVREDKSVIIISQRNSSAGGAAVL